MNPTIGPIAAPYPPASRQCTAAPQEDPREEELPNVGLVSVRDPESGTTGVLDTGSRRVRKAYADNARMARELLRDTFRRTGVDLLELSTGEDYDRHLVRFFHDRARRAARAGG